MKRAVRGVPQHRRHTTMGEDDIGDFLEGRVITPGVGRALFVGRDEHTRLRQDAVDVHANIRRIGL